MSADKIQQIFGNAIDPFETAQNVYCIRSIAWSLSMQCRFNGHVKRFYSVAEHCHTLSFIVPREYALMALLHDAAETYIGDVVVPVKRRLADLKTYEHSLEASIMSFFGVNTSGPDARLVDFFDKRIVKNEWLEFCSPMPMPKSIEQLEEIDGLKLVGVSQEVACGNFLARFVQLTAGV